MEWSLLRQTVVKLETCTAHQFGKEQSTKKGNTTSLPKSTGLKLPKTSLLMSLHTVTAPSPLKTLLTPLIKLKS